MDEINLTEYLLVIWRRRVLVGSIAAIAALIALVMLLMAPHTYRGKAVLIFPRQEQSSALGLLSKLGVSGIGDFGGSGSNVGLYMEVLKSRTLSEQVSRDLQLNAVIEDVSELQDKIDVTPTKEGALQICCYAPSSWIKKGKLKRKLEGDTIERQTANFAAELTNAYVRKLQEFDRQHTMSASRRNREFLEGEVAKTRKELIDAEDALRKFKESHPAMPPPETMNQQVEQLITLRTKQIEAEAELRETEKSVTEAKGIVEDQEVVLAASRVIQENPVVSQLKSRLAQAEVLRARLLEDMTEKSPDVIAATQEIEKIQEQIKSEIPKIIASETMQINPVRQSLVQNLAQLEIKKSGVQARLDTLGMVIKRVESEISSIAKDQMRYVRLMREAKALESVYTSLLTQLSQAKVLEAKEPEGFTVLDWATAERFHYKPKIKLTLAASFMLGLIAGCLLAIIRESSRPSTKRRASS